MTLLRRRLSSWKRKTLEQRLMAGCVRVNGEVVTRNDLLAAGDEVVVAGADEAAGPRPGGLPVLYEDDALIAVNKPAGLLSVSTDRQTGRTALARVRDSLSRPGLPARLWPVHRLDRETSGVLLFAKTREAQKAVQER
jgi:23S rRNA pseudouridine1911/1915/1917 synthase